MAGVNIFSSSMDLDGRQDAIVSFRCGKCIINGNCVSPDVRKGRLLLVDGEDGLMHLRWIDRQNNRVEDDLIVISDAYLEHVPQCTTGRVYVLRFTSSDKKLLFWLQEPNASKDDQLISLFNQHAGGGPPAAPAIVDQSQSQESIVTEREIFSEETTSQLRQLLQGFSRQSQVNLSPNITVPFSSVLNGDVVRRVGNDDIALKELSSLLPRGYDSNDDVRETLKCPQLAHALSGVSQAVYTDAAALLGSMGISLPSTSFSPPVDPMTIFAEALEEKFKDITCQNVNSVPNDEHPNELEEGQCMDEEPRPE